MIGIRYENDYLDVFPNAALSFELNNLVFSGSDSSVLPGSFSFPFDLPATPHNRAQFNFPERIDNAQVFRREGSVEIYFRGVLLFVGILKVTEASIESIRVYIVANPLSTLKTVPLNELDLGGTRTFADEAAVLTHAAATAADPLDYDYVFFPVWNPNFLDEASAEPRARFQNFYNSDTSAFEVDHEFPALMPFVRLEYLLTQIFAGAEYTFLNLFQVDDELRNIVLYNNYSLWTAEGLSITISLNNHVSSTGAAAFVRKIMGAFCLGLFYNPWEKVLRLIPIQTILQRPPQHDWTEKALHSPTITSNAAQPELLCWKRDDDDGAWAHYEKYPKPADADIDGELLNSGLTAAAAGTYYVIDRHSYYLKTSVPRYFFKHTTLGCAPAEVAGQTTRTGAAAGTVPTFEAECQALFDGYLYGEGQTPIATGNYVAAPHCRIAGNVEYEYDPGGGDIEVRNQENDVPDRITIYRGMYPDFDGDDYPFASGLPWDTESNLIGQYSLRWDSQYGMYTTWWQAWHTMLKEGKQVSVSLHLSITDLLEFNFENKVRIGSMDYMVKKLRISLTARGIEPVEAELVSVI